ncbi:ESPR-type extended signal peptide-containing protein, partial [Rodentibacter caecimuris]|uniref:ESPR-type extended signal peptide-containing protein n=1 Tax=Rodentibacter caecimuris TaxID=1796644 RepID=UPI0023D8BEE1
MNKIFKVIFNHTTQSWTAVSELAKGYSKSSSRGEKANRMKIFAISAFVAGATILSSEALAVIAGDTEIKADNGAIAIAGGESEAPGSMAIGPNAKIGGAGLPGWVNKAALTDSLAIGKDAIANGLRVISIGKGSKTNNQDSIAIGVDTVTHKQNATAVGYQATVSASAATHSVALGSGSVANAVNSVSDLSFKGDNGSDTTANIAAKDAHSVLSIGNNNHKRQIVNVAAGRVSQDSTDAVIGSQLYAVMTHSGFNIKENGSSKSRINNNGQVDFANGSYTTASVTDGSNSATVKVNVVTQDISTDNKGVTSVSGTSGLTTAKTVSDAINNALNNSSFTLKANSDAGTAIKRNGYIDIKSGKNVNVSRDGSVITIKTVDNPTFTDVTTNNLTAKEQISGKNLTVSGTSNLQNVNVNQQFSANGDVSLGAAGKTVTFVSGTSINAGGNRISGVATGTDKTDAVNKGQLDDAISNITNTTNAANTAVNAANTTANNANTTANNANTT